MQQSQPTSRRSKETTKRTVLLADDDEEFRETLVIWLASEEGWYVREAADGEDVLSKIDESVDVLVLDRRMPNLSGPEVIDRIDETEFDGDVFVLSAYEADEHLNGDGDRITAYITKPIRREEFLERLETGR
ncbi:response regulator receiver protein [Halogeometricum pallidum JCM 14848]|uniref:Response regulator receiver protein n=1 Tax=Halogeometricum pallidum JCM 14848 TaxID=1227487 RepID=M0CXC6_HALPD|nr:response regulator [Halogeometricum pallidum]ELZ27082.1 response regulator receiver protein [Halogeometricum pallidum JCM 14848]